LRVTEWCGNLIAEYGPIHNDIHQQCEASMDIHSVITRTLTDTHFEADLRKKAKAAQGKVPGSPEFNALIAEFAQTPQELAYLQSAHATQAPGGPSNNLGWRTTLTTLTITTAACTTTTTSTTTTW
jgi:hypothetical protein